MTNKTENNTSQMLPKIKTINRSGKSGLGTDLSIRLENKDYEIISIENDLGSSETNTVIVYKPVESKSDFVLSQLIYGALLSAYDDKQSQQSEITTYVGSDLENAVQ
jgi:hypothetical protein